MEINLEEYYKRYGPMVLRRCIFLLRDEEKAKDAMQDVFLRLLRYKDRLKGTYPSSLLFRMATNVCLNMIRSSKRPQEITGEDALLNIASYDDSEEKIILNDFLDFIFQREKNSTRDIAVFHYIDKMTFAEIARETGLSVSGIRKRLKNLQVKVRNLSKSEEVHYERN